MRQQAEMRLGEAAGSSNEAETTDGIALFVRVCSASPPHPFGSPSRAGAWGATATTVRPRVLGRGGLTLPKGANGAQM